MLNFDALLPPGWSNRASKKSGLCFSNSIYTLPSQQHKLNTDYFCNMIYVCAPHTKIKLHNIHIYIQMIQHSMIHWIFLQHNFFISKELFLYQRKIKKKYTTINQLTMIFMWRCVKYLLVVLFFNNYSYNRFKIK